MYYGFLQKRKPSPRDKSKRKHLSVLEHQSAKNPPIPPSRQPSQNQDPIPTLPTHNRNHPKPSAPLAPAFPAQIAPPPLSPAQPTVLPRRNPTRPLTSHTRRVVAVHQFAAAATGMASRRDAVAAACAVAGGAPPPYVAGGIASGARTVRHSFFVLICCGVGWVCGDLDG